MRGAGGGGLLCTVFAPEEGLQGRGGLETELDEGVCPFPGLLGPVAARRDLRDDFGSPDYAHSLDDDLRSNDGSFTRARDACAEQTNSNQGLQEHPSKHLSIS